MNDIDITGTIGVALILLAYFGSVFQIMSGNGKTFFVLNIIGAVLACYASLLLDYWPFVILEGMWTLVSMIGLFRTIRSASNT